MRYGGITLSAIIGTFIMGENSGTITSGNSLNISRISSEKSRSDNRPLLSHSTQVIGTTIMIKNGWTEQSL
jgi:hypothetical protein